MPPISCDHPRPKLVLPSYTPPKLNWQVPALLPGIEPNSARAILEALRGIYNEMLKRFAEPTIVPLIEDMQARPGQVIKGVGAGQVITLIEPGFGELLDPVTIVLTAVSDAVSVRMPDGTVVTLTVPGVYTVLPDSDGSYQVPPGDIGLVGIQAISDGISSISSGTVFVNSGFAFQVSTVVVAPNVALRVSGQSLVGRAWNEVQGSQAYGISFNNANGVSFSASPVDVATLGRIINFTASVDALKQFRLSDIPSSIVSSLSNATNSAISNATIHLPWGSSVASQNSRGNVHFMVNSDSLMAIARLGVSGAGGSILVTGVEFSNVGAFSFGIATSTNSNGRFGIITGSQADPGLLISHVGGASANSATVIAFSNGGGVTWSLSTGAFGATVNATAGAGGGGVAISAGTQSVSTGTVAFANSNGITFGMSGSSQVTASYARELGLVSHIGGNSVASVTRLAFSNASNVTWSLSTAAGAATVLGSVVAGITALPVSAGTTNVAATQISFANSNNVSFTLNGSTINASASFPAQTAQTFIGGIAGGTQTATSGTIVFSNSNNVSFGLSGSTRMTASYALRVSGGASTADVSNLVFTNTNNVGFAASTDANGATIRAAASINFSAGTTNGAQSVISFADSNRVSFGLNASTITATVSPDIGVVSHVGGNVVSSVTRLAFSNASNVTFSLSTAANAATLLASVAAAGGGGVAVADVYGNTVTNGTVLWTVGPNSTLSNLWSAGTISNNVAFGLNGSTWTGQAHIRISDDSAGSGNAATRINFMNANGISWGMSTAQSAAGDRQVNVTASAFVPQLPFWFNFDHGWGNPNFFIATHSMDTKVKIFPLGGGKPAFPGDITINTLGFLWSNSVTQSASFASTIRGGVYTQVNSTQLSLVNSFSAVFSATTQSSLTRSQAYQGARYLTVHSSQWSSQPVLKYGSNYWFAYAYSTAGVNQGFIALQPSPNGVLWFPQWRGEVNVSMASGSTLSSPHLIGALNTNNIPASIGVTQLLSGTNATAAEISNAYNSVPGIAFFQSMKPNYP